MDAVRGILTPEAEGAVWPSEKQLDILAYDGSGQEGLFVLRSAGGKHYVFGMEGDWYNVSDSHWSAPDLCGAHVWEKRSRW
jgi:hypothetical protein